jgi:hypothetical protein
MRGSELQGRQRAHTRAEHNHPFATELVDHRDHVVDDALNQAALHRRNRIRRACPTWVEPNVAAERRQPVQEPNEPRFIPHQIDGKDDRLGDQHIRRSSAHDLIADPTTTGLGVHRLWHAHQSSLSQPRRSVTGLATPQNQQLDFHRLVSP